MERIQLQYFRQRLTEEKDRLTDEIGQIDHTGLAASLRDSVAEFSAYDNHPADLGTETFERSKDLALKDNARILLTQVNAALDKIGSGTYGACEKCGKPIAIDRLEAVPYTTLCLACKEAAEARDDRPSRPAEEELLSPPFGRTFLDDTDYTGFDGEDAWQAVARYGTAESPQDVPGTISYDNLYVDGRETLGAVQEIEQVSDAAFEPGTPDGPKRLSLWALGEENAAKVRAKFRQRQQKK